VSYVTKEDMFLTPAYRQGLMGSGQGFANVAFPRPAPPPPTNVARGGGAEEERVRYRAW